MFLFIISFSFLLLLFDINYSFENFSGKFLSLPSVKFKIATQHCVPPGQAHLERVNLWKYAHVLIYENMHKIGNTGTSICFEYLNFFVA
jgi:hypothetical protein